MFQIQNLTSDARQKQTLVLPDGTSIQIQLYFVPMQQGWFITKLTYKNFELDGIRVVVSPNMLHQFRNQIPFGLTCITNQSREPSLQQDFLSGAFELYVLDATEVEAYEEYLVGQV